MTYSEKEYYTRTKGYTVEARSEKLYVTKDTERESYWSDGFQSFDMTVSKNFRCRGGVITPDRKFEISMSTCEELDRRDFDVLDRIDALFQEVGF